MNRIIVPLLGVVAVTVFSGCTAMQESARIRHEQAYQDRRLGYEIGRSATLEAQLADLESRRDVAQEKLNDVNRRLGNLRSQVRPTPSAPAPGEDVASLKREKERLEDEVADLKEKIKILAS